MCTVNPQLAELDRQGTSLPTSTHVDSPPCWVSDHDLNLKESQKLGRIFSCRVTLIEARELLGTFAASLRRYAVKRLEKQGVILMKVNGH